MRRFMVAGLVLLSTSFALAATTGYKVLSEVKIGGEGGWDYLTVDAAARRLYVSHATHVAVVDATVRKMPGLVPPILATGRSIVAADSASFRSP